MRNLHVMVGLCLLAFAAAIGSGLGQDKKGDKDTQPGVKGTLPANWGKLGLTPDQKSKVYAVQAIYKPKIDNLKKEIKHLQDEEYSEEYKILNDDQKAALKKILDKGGDAGKETKKDDKKETGK